METYQFLVNTVETQTDDHQFLINGRYVKTSEDLEYPDKTKLCGHWKFRTDKKLTELNNLRNEPGKETEVDILDVLTTMLCSIHSSVKSGTRELTEGDIAVIMKDRP
jgi:hypothetical protein